MAGPKSLMGRVFPGILILLLINIQILEARSNNAITEISDTCPIPACRKIAWMKWTVLSHQKYYGTTNRGTVVLDIDSLTGTILSGLYSLTLGSPVFSPSNLDFTPTPHMPSVSNVTKLIHRINLDSIPDVTEAFILVGSYPNSNHSSFSGRPQIGKLRAYDKAGNQLNIPDVCEAWQDQLNPPVLSPTIVTIGSNEISLWVNDPSVSDGSLVVFKGFPSNTAYVEAEHNNDQSAQWDGIYINVGIPDCCPLVVASKEVVPCTSDSNYTFKSVIDLVQPFPTGKLKILLDNNIVRTLNPPYTAKIPIDLSGLKADGNGHTFSFYFEDSPDCIHKITYNAPLPISPPIILGNNKVCDNSLLDLSTKDPALKYQWRGPNNFATNNMNVLINPINQVHAGIYSLTITDINNCTASANIKVEINNSSVHTIIEEVCDSIIINGILYNKTGNYTQQFKNSIGCDSLLNIQLNVIAGNPTILDAGNDTTVCEGAFIQLAAKFSGKATYLWQSVSGNFDKPFEVNTNYYPAKTGVEKIYFLATDACQTWFDSFNVTVIPNTIVMVTGDSLIDPCKEIIFEVSGGRAYTWTPANQVECLDAMCTRVRLLSITNENLIVNSTEPCSTPATINLSFLKSATDLFVPNVFSPNGDQVNDFFIPEFNCDKFNYYLLQIFDRWGNLVFESNDKDTGWDGNWKGDKMLPGVYPYVIEYGFHNGERKIKAGDVTLIR